MISSIIFFFFFFFNDTPPTEIYTLSLHDALPISYVRVAITPWKIAAALQSLPLPQLPRPVSCVWSNRSEEHTSELQSLRHLVCRLLLEKKKKKSITKNSKHQTI